MRPISESISRVASHSFEKKYIALGRILGHWEEIMGPELAHKTRPVKMRYQNDAGNGGKPRASLDIEASSADSTLLHYRKDLILERINAVFGDYWIAAIRFVIAPSNVNSPAFRRMPRPLSPSEQLFVENATAQITDEEIKKQLEQLGQAILRDKGQK